MNTLDHMLSAGGYQRVDCRNCKNRFVVSIEEWNEFLKASTAANGRPLAPARIEKPPAVPVPSVASAPSAAADAADTMIGPGMVLEGEMHTREDICIFGEMEGTLDASGCLVVIAQGGSIAGSVKAGHVMIHGRLRAPVVNADRITVCSDGSLIANVKANSIVVEDGAYLRGKIETID